MPEPMVVVMTKDKETKNSVRFNAGVEGDPHSKNIYLLKTEVAALGNPSKIKVTIEPAA